MSAGEQTGVAGGAGSDAEGGAGPDLVRQMARDLAEDDVVQREAVAHMPHELELVDHARLLREWRDLLRGRRTPTARSPA